MPTLKPLLRGGLFLGQAKLRSAGKALGMASFSCGCPTCLPMELVIVPLGQVGGEILIPIQAHQEGRGQEVVERDVRSLIVEHGIGLRTGEKLAADLPIFHSQDDSDLSGL